MYSLSFFDGIALRFVPCCRWQLRRAPREVFFLTRMEIGEAPPAADKASRFRGSGTIGALERARES